MQLSNIPHIRVYPSEANYLLCEYTGKLDITQLAENLLSNHNLLVKNLKYKLQGRKFMRFAVLDSKKNDALLGALRKEVEAMR